MPSLQDVANQILGVLNQVQANTAASATTELQIKGDTADIKTKLDGIESTLQNGFLSVDQGLFAILEQEKETNSLLIAEVAQNNTIICWLTNIADVLCRIMRKTNTEVELQTHMRDVLEHLAKIEELVHSEAAVQVERDERLETKIEECCPPTEPPPEVCYEPCESPDITIYKPRGSDWQPPKKDNIG
jgi:hypothetical protein